MSSIFVDATDMRGRNKNRIRKVGQKPIAHRLLITQIELFASCG